MTEIIAGILEFFLPLGELITNKNKSKNQKLLLATIYLLSVGFLILIIYLLSLNV